MEWQFTLNGTTIEEPIGFSRDVTFNLIRSEKWHGIMNELASSNSRLGFYGIALTILTEAKQQYGFDAEVIFIASARCEGQTDFEEVINGKVDFGAFSELCGNECLVNVGIEQSSCSMVFQNRFDQKVNIDSNIAFDKATILADYTGLGFEMELATQEIPIAADAEVLPDGDVVNLDIVTFFGTDDPTLYIRPIYGTVNDNSIATAQLDSGNFYQDPDNTFLLSPQLLLEENPDCISTDFTYNIRTKGRATATKADLGDHIKLWLVMDTWDGNGEHHVNGVQIEAVVIQESITSGVAYEFDEVWTGTLPIISGQGLYVYIQYTYEGGGGLTSIITDVVVEFDPETSFVISNSKACPPTPAEVYLVNETLARAIEAITDRCLTIQSDYYGRTDSQPYASVIDGCGSLRVVTPGLKIRQATDKQFFASMKELMEGLRAIDNIGMGMESDRVRIEPAEWFYQDVKILDLPLVPGARFDTQSALAFSNIKYGYNKWEIKSIKGIDEFNSYKERRTGVKSVSNELDITSNLIASGYIIEDLRTRTLAGTGNTDTTYDNDVFIICVERDGYGFHVEQGITQDAANFFSPATAYNWRIRPLYNLMRWFKSIAQTYVNTVSTTSKLFFTSGKGNYEAEGQLWAYDPCRMENKVLAENDDLHATDFENTIDATPIYKPETVIFEYPLSVADYRTIKNNPYGYMNVQCGGGMFFKAYIKTMNYKLAEGKADFNLILKWV